MNDDEFNSPETANLSVFASVHTSVEDAFREDPTEWWGPTAAEVAPEDIAGTATVGSRHSNNLRSKKMTVPNRDGTKSRPEVTVTKDEFETVRKPRKSRPTPEAPYVCVTEVPDLIAWLDATEVPAAKEFAWVRVPLTSPGAVTWERVVDTSTAQQIRRLRKPPDDDSDRAERCVSAPFGCTNPVAYRNPPACPPCKKYAYDHDGQFPPPDIIAKRNRRAERRAQETTRNDP